MKRLFFFNLIVLILFLIISSVTFYLEAYFIESTNELILIINYIVFFIALLYVNNRNTIIKFKNKFNKFAINTFIANFVFIFGFALSYILNWYLLFPVFNN